MEKRRTRRESSAAREMEKKKKRQEEYLNAMNDLEMLRDHYKNELKIRLEKKVKQQREERKRRTELEHLANLKTQEQTMKVSKNKLPRSNGADNTEFLKKIPVSRNYNILKIQDHLEKKNELNKMHKMDEFHKLISIPGVLEKLQKQMEMGEEVTFDRLCKLAKNKSATKLDKLRYDTDNKDIEAISPINDGEYFSRDAPTRIKSDKKKFRDVKNSEIEELFPAIEYPKLLMVDRDLSSPEPDPVKTRRLRVHERRSSQLEEQKRLLTIMFEQSVANEAATGRLMKKYKQLNFASLAQGNDVSTLMAVGKSSQKLHNDTMIERFLVSQTNELSSRRLDTNRNIEEYLASLSETRINDRSVLPVIHEDHGIQDEEDESRSSAKISNQSFTRGEELKATSDELQTRTAEWHEQEQSRRRIKLVPLTMKALEETSQVKIVGERGKVWINPV